MVKYRRHPIKINRSFKTEGAYIRYLLRCLKGNNWRQFMQENGIEPTETNRVKLVKELTKYLERIKKDPNVTLPDLSAHHQQLYNTFPYTSNHLQDRRVRYNYNPKPRRNTPITVEQQYSNAAMITNNPYQSPYLSHPSISPTPQNTPHYTGQVYDLNAQMAAAVRSGLTPATYMPHSSNAIYMPQSSNLQTIQQVPNTLLTEANISQEHNDPNQPRITSFLGNSINWFRRTSRTQTTETTQTSPSTPNVNQTQVVNNNPPEQVVNNNPPEQVVNNNPPEQVVNNNPPEQQPNNNPPEQQHVISVNVPSTVVQHPKKPKQSEPTEAEEDDLLVDYISSIQNPIDGRIYISDLFQLGRNDFLGYSNTRTGYTFYFSQDGVDVPVGIPISNGYLSKYKIDKKTSSIVVNNLNAKPTDSDKIIDNAIFYDANHAYIHDLDYQHLRGAKLKQLPKGLQKMNEKEANKQQKISNDSTVINNNNNNNNNNVVNDSTVINNPSSVIRQLTPEEIKRRQQEQMNKYANYNPINNNNNNENLPVQDVLQSINGYRGYNKNGNILSIKVLVPMNDGTTQEGNINIDFSKTRKIKYNSSDNTFNINNGVKLNDNDYKQELYLLSVINSYRHDKGLSTFDTNTKSLRHKDSNSSLGYLAVNGFINGINLANDVIEGTADVAQQIGQATSNKVSQLIRRASSDIAESSVSLAKSLSNKISNSITNIFNKYASSSDQPTSQSQAPPQLPPPPLAPQAPLESTFAENTPAGNLEKEVEVTKENNNVPQENNNVPQENQENLTAEDSEETSVLVLPRKYKKSKAEAIKSVEKEGDLNDNIIHASKTPEDNIVRNNLSRKNRKQRFLEALSNRGVNVPELQMQGRANIRRNSKRKHFFFDEKAEPDNNADVDMEQSIDENGVDDYQNLLRPTQSGQHSFKLDNFIAQLQKDNPKLIVNLDGNVLTLQNLEGSSNKVKLDLKSGKQYAMKKYKGVEFIHIDPNSKPEGVLDDFFNKYFHYDEVEPINIEQDYTYFPFNDDTNVPKTTHTSNAQKKFKQADENDIKNCLYKTDQDGVYEFSLHDFVKQLRKKYYGAYAKIRNGYLDISFGGLEQNTIDLNKGQRYSFDPDTYTITLNTHIPIDPNVARTGIMTDLFFEDLFRFDNLNENNDPKQGKSVQSIEGDIDASVSQLNKKQKIFGEALKAIRAGDTKKIEELRKEDSERVSYAEQLLKDNPNYKTQTELIEEEEAAKHKGLETIPEIDEAFIPEIYFGQMVRHPQGLYEEEERARKEQAKYIFHEALDLNIKQRAEKLKSDVEALKEFKRKTSQVLTPAEDKLLSDEDKHLIILASEGDWYDPSLKEMRIQAAVKHKLNEAIISNELDNVDLSKVDLSDIINREDGWLNEDDKKALAVAKQNGWYVPQLKEHLFNNYLEKKTAESEAKKAVEVYSVTVQDSKNPQTTYTNKVLEDEKTGNVIIQQTENSTGTKTSTPTPANDLDKTTENTKFSRKDLTGGTFIDMSHATFTFEKDSNPSHINFGQLLGVDGGTIVDVLKSTEERSSKVLSYIKQMSPFATDPDGSYFDQAYEVVYNIIRSAAQLSVPAAMATTVYTDQLEKNREAINKGIDFVVDSVLAWMPGLTLGKKFTVWSLTKIAQVLGNMFVDNKEISISRKMQVISASLNVAVSFLPPPKPGSPIKKLLSMGTVGTCAYLLYTTPAGVLFPTTASDATVTIIGNTLYNLVSFAKAYALGLSPGHSFGQLFDSNFRSLVGYTSTATKAIEDVKPGMFGTAWNFVKSFNPFGSKAKVSSGIAKVTHSGGSIPKYLYFEELDGPRMNRTNHTALKHYNYIKNDDDDDMMDEDGDIEMIRW